MLPVQVIGLELYDDAREGKVHEQGIIRTQWLEASSELVGKRILIVDEVGTAVTGAEDWAAECYECYVHWD